MRRASLEVSGRMMACLGPGGSRCTLGLKSKIIDRHSFTYEDQPEAQEVRRFERKAPSTWSHILGLIRDAWF